LLIKSLGAALCLVGLTQSSLATEKRFSVGNFAVTTDQDPMDDRTNYFAAIGTPDAMVIARCLQGHQSILVVSPGEGESGDQIPVKARFDSGEVNEFPGEVLNKVGNLLGVEFGDADTIGKMSGAKRLAVRLTISGVDRTYAFDMKNSKAVAEGIAAACKPPA
jgi:hypothetical protein